MCAGVGRRCSTTVSKAEGSEDAGAAGETGEEEGRQVRTRTSRPSELSLTMLNRSATACHNTSKPQGIAPEGP